MSDARDVVAQAFSRTAVMHGLRIREVRYAMADDLLAAVEPLIRAEVAERIAQRMEAAGTLDGNRWQDKAARIAREYGERG